MDVVSLVEGGGSGRTWPSTEAKLPGFSGPCKSPMQEHWGFSGST